MDESSGNDKKGDGASAAAAASAPGADWELLSMSMTASVSDLKTALAAAEAEQEEGGDGGVSDVALHSQYFGQVMAHVLPPPSGEIFAQDGGKQPDPDTGGDKPQAEELEVEQQNLEAEAAASAAPAAAAAVKMDEDVASEAVVVAAVVSSVSVSLKENAVEKAPRSGEWVKRRLQMVLKKVNRSSTVWSIALVATVTGLIIIGKRWYCDSLRSLDLDLDSYSSDEAMVAEFEGVDGDHGAAAAAAGGAESVEGQPASGGLFGSLRDLW